MASKYSPYSLASESECMLQSCLYVMVACLSYGEYRLKNCTNNRINAVFKLYIVFIALYVNVHSMSISVKIHSVMS